MAELYGSVAAAAATAFDRRLSQLAKQVCPADPRTLDQRRADALAALTDGVSWPAPADNRSARSRVTTRRRIRPGRRWSSTWSPAIRPLSAKGLRPAYLEGYGVIDAEQVRELAAAASLLVADPLTSPADALRYQPSAALERAIRCRDLTCRFPGCSRPAIVCDIDHTIPFNHQNPAAGGLTVAGNLKCLCRQHHRLKTFGGWRDKQLADGTVIWTLTHGRTYRTSPAGADLFPQPRGPACAAPVPEQTKQIEAAKRSNCAGAQA